MEAKLWLLVYQIVEGIAHPRQKRQQFCDRTILLVLIWAAIQRRPIYWACNIQNWPRQLQEYLPVLPEDSTMSRRLRSLSFLQLLERTMQYLVELLPPTLVKQFDSKPLYVGGFSKDKDAKRGKAAGQMARGYKIHMCASGRYPRHFQLAPMNDHDATLAVRLIERLQGYGYVVADNAYDSNGLHQQAAEAQHQLVVPPRTSNQGVRDVRHNRPERLRSLDLLDSPLKHCGEQSVFGRQLYNQRVAIESCFGELSMLGLDHLPHWVRRPRRVARWVAAVLIIYLAKNANRRKLLPKQKTYGKDAKS